MTAVNHNRVFRTLGCVSVGLFLVGLVFWSSAAPAFADNRDVFPPPVEWMSQDHRDHALVGKVWSRKADGFVTPQVLGTAVAKARFILLGEVHDNPDHHLWQAWAIRNISKLRGARLVEGAPQIEIVALEMLRADQIPALDKFYGRDAEVPRPRGARAFGRMLKWKDSGWPDFKMYRPIVEAALSNQFVIVPASPTREENKEVSKKGLAGIGDARALALDTPLKEAASQALAEEIKTGHCGMLPDKSIAPMSLVQRFRDAVMADALLNVSAERGGVLIAGNGHVRRDRAVPWYLEARGVAPETIVTVAHMEVDGSDTDPASYIPRDGSGAAAVDFVVFTPATAREDMCEQMRAYMAKHNDAKSKKQPKSE